METNESVVIMSAVRYMLGRNSYGVGSVIDHVKTITPRLTISNKQIIIQNIMERIEDDIPQANQWLELVEFLKAAK